MGMSNFADLIVVFCMMNTPSIPILMAQSAGVNFSFPQFTRCNASDILCISDAAISEHEIHLTNSTNAHYKLTGKTVGRVVYNQTISLSSLASFTADIQFVMKYYHHHSPGDYGGHGIAFFMTSKEIATQWKWSSHAGLPGDGYQLSADTFAVEFSSVSSRVHTKVGNNRPIQRYNYTQLNESLNDGTLWNAQIDYNDRKKYLKIFLSNSSNSSMFQKDPILEHSFDCSKYLPHDFVVGISASAENSSQTHKIFSWSFNTSIKTGKFSMKVIIVTIVGVFFGLAGAVGIWSLFFIAKKRRLGSSSGQKCEDNDIEIGMLVDQGPTRYKLDDLKAGTSNFSESLKLGQGGFGGVYKGVVGEANEVVAVKRISERSRQGIREFISEISIVSRVRHRNLVQLLGWCHEKGELLLVYEYMSNGSLDKHLFSKGNSSLQWNRRYQIALEIACALLYLHEEWDQCIVHRDVKSSNVMLDCNFNAKLGDFGLARMLEHNCLSQTTKWAGTLGYLAPECVITGRTSPESDVYSFGAMALEIATGRRVVDASLQEHDMRLVEWVWDLYGQGQVLEAADEKLNGEFEKAEMKQLIEIGLWCSHPNVAARPKMRQVVKLLKLEDQVPNLPPEIPEPTYASFHGAKLLVASSEPSHALPSFASTLCYSTASSTSLSAGAQVISSQLSS